MKDILKLINIIFFLLLPVFESMASEEVVLRQYGYGLLKWNGTTHKNPEIYPLLESNWYVTEETKASDIGPFFKTSDAESDAEQARSGVKLNLEIKQKRGYIFAIVSFSNKSTQSYFIHKHDLPASYLDASMRSSFCSNIFLITTDGIRLDYLSGWCEYESNYDRDAWVEIPAGKVIYFTARLNDGYSFPSGIRRYNIGTMEFSLVNNRWFLEGKINSTLFSILTQKDRCEVGTEINYLLDRVKECDSNGNNNIEEFMISFGYYGGNENSYYFRSNQKVVVIDGRKVKSIYDGKR
ncbi:hypothetical protein GJV06_21795 [Enterobacteriaceae bacterium RIT691]|nr:hypothetical protein [Enterobacteriaceae bacterium RIT691]